MEDIYPTKDELRELEAFAQLKDFVDLINVIDTIKSMWTCEDRVEYISNGDEWTLYLSTVGWSGNEQIIDTLSTSIFWFLYWQKSERGGHYWFRGNKSDKYVSHNATY